MEYFAQKVLKTLITCNSLIIIPTDFKAGEIYDSFFCISIQKNLLLIKLL